MRKKLSTFLVCFLSAILFLTVKIEAQSNTEYDIVLEGGRVIDPETKLDAIRNVGIINNRIAQISSEPLKGKQVINAAGLVVAPRLKVNEMISVVVFLVVATILCWGLVTLKGKVNKRYLSNQLETIEK